MFKREFCDIFNRLNRKSLALAVKRLMVKIYKWKFVDYEKTFLLAVDCMLSIKLVKNNNKYNNNNSYGYIINLNISLIYPE